jgi:hypothetical protein
MFSPPSTIGWGCNFDKLFIQMFSEVWTVKIINKFPGHKWLFLNSRSLFFKVSLVMFHNCWIDLQLGYVMLNMMQYKVTVGIDWLLNVQRIMNKCYKLILWFNMKCVIIKIHSNYKGEIKQWVYIMT